MAPKDKELYETLFKDLSPVEYLKITKIANWKKFKSGDTFMRGGTIEVKFIKVAYTNIT